MTSPKFAYLTRFSGHIACFLLACLAFMPALAHSGLPAGADIAAHFWRVFELNSQWSEGVFYPRWAEHFYYGYGAPTFQYTASGFYIVAGIIGKLPFVDDGWALKLTWFIALNLCTFGMYTYSSRRWGVMGGLLSATAFTFAPVLIGNEALGRGAFPVIWGMGWLVMSIALLDRYAITKKGAGWAVLAIFGLLWSHNLTAISGAGLIGAWLIFSLIVKRASMPYLRGAIALFVMGCATSAFFWIPVLLERGYVSLDAFQFNPHMRYQNHFYTVWQLLDGLQPHDFGLSIQPERFTIGVVTWGAIIIMGLWAICRGMIVHAPTPLKDNNRRDGINAVPVGGRDISRPYETLFWLVITVASLFLVLPESQFLWDDIETLQTFVFPARFLNITALALAMLIGAGITVIRWRWVGTLLMALLIVQGWHSTVIDWRDDFPANATPRDYLYYEFETNDLATTSANEFKPRSVPNIPPATGFLVDSLINGTPALRVNPDAYGEGVIFTPIKSTAEDYVLEISSDVPVSLEIFQFYFVGWIATLDDTPLGISASGDFGFIRTDMIPAGTHTLRLMRSMTNPQQLGIIVSVIAVFITGGWMVINKQKSYADENPVRAQHVAPLRPLTILLMALLITVPLTIIIMREGVAWVESTPTEAKLARNPDYQTFGDIAFLGYDFSETEYAFYWYIPEGQTVNISITEADEYGELDVVNYFDIKGDKRLMRFVHRSPYEYYAPIPRVTLWQCTEGNPPDCPRVVLGELP
ncbi:MAG: hypothetical protein SFZ02_10450 [bacterium]|nr:hypothetical protein [bacterium]